MSLLDDIMNEGKEKEPAPMVMNEIAGPVDEGMFESLKNLLTGADRETIATDRLPSLAEVGIKDFLSDSSMKQIISASTGMLLERDPEQQIRILKRNSPTPISITNDKAGNFILSNGNRQVMLNKPGVSGLDVMQLGADAAAFAPASRATSLVGGIAAGTATQAGLEGIATATGSDQGALEAAGDSALTGLTFGIFNTVFQALGPAARSVVDTIKNTGPGKAVRSIVSRKVNESPEVLRAADELGLTPEEITEQFIVDAKNAAESSINPSEIGAVALEREFNAPILTRGQRTLDQPQLRREDALRSGLGGETAENIMRNSEETAQTTLRNVAGDIQSEIAGGAPLIEARQEAGSALAAGVRNSEDAASALVSDAYAEVGSAALEPQGFKNLLSAIRRSVRGMDFIKSEALAPATAQLLKDLSKAEKDLVKIEGMKGARLRPVDLRHIETIKRTINQMGRAAANDSDRRSIKAMSVAFEKSLDDSVMKMLFSGDQESLAALRSARTIAADYFKKFTAQPSKTKSGRTIPDAEGSFIEKIIAANPTDEEVINSLFSASSFSKQSASKMAQKYKEILGSGSDEWNQVRQAAFRNLVKTNKFNGEDVISGQKSLKALDDAIKQNKSLIEELYTPAEIGKIRRFFTLVKRSQPDITRSRMNPSGSGITKILGELGFLGVDVASLGAGTRVLEAVSRAIVAPRQAQNAVRPFNRVYSDLKPLSGPTAVLVNKDQSDQERQPDL